MLTAIPKNWFSWDFAVQEGEKPVAKLDLSLWREKGTLTIEGKDYRVYREGLLRGEFCLECEGKILARAEKPSAFRRSYIVSHAGREYTLQARSPWRRPFILLQGSQEIGSIAPQRIFTRKANADLPDSLPLPLRVFLLWLTVILWKREAESAAAASGG